MIDLIGSSILEVNKKLEVDYLQKQDQPDDVVTQKAKDGIRAQYCAKEYVPGENYYSTTVIKWSAVQFIDDDRLLSFAVQDPTSIYVGLVEYTVDTVGDISFPVAKYIVFCLTKEVKRSGIDHFDTWLEIENNNRIICSWVYTTREHDGCHQKEEKIVPNRSGKVIFRRTASGQLHLSHQTPEAKYEYRKGDTAPKVIIL